MTAVLRCTLRSKQLCERGQSGAHGRKRVSNVPVCTLHPDRATQTLFGSKAGHVAVKLKVKDSLQICHERLTALLVQAFAVSAFKKICHNSQWPLTWLGIVFLAGAGLSPQISIIVAVCFGHDMS